MKEKEEERLKELKKIELEYHKNGIKYIAGIDEAGRGPLKRFLKRKEKNYMMK